MSFPASFSKRYVVLALGVSRYMVRLTVESREP
jgi:hypothetical protein